MDASFKTHVDGKGHVCIVITMGSGVVYVKSFKIKMQVLSSTEAEQYGMSEAATFVKWGRSMMRKMGQEQKGPSRMYHDNLSAIWLTHEDASFARNKHILVRRNYCKEAVAEGSMVVIHTGTEKMWADIGTKILPPASLGHMMDGIGMLQLEKF